VALSERDLQTICVTYFRQTYPDYLIWSSLSGIKLSGKQKYGVLESERKSGFIRGIPDLYAALPNGKSLHIEMKTPSGKQSTDQVTMEANLTKLGHKYYICRSLQEFKQIIEENL